MLEDTVPETVTQIGTRQGDNDPAGLTGVALCLICCRAVERICFLQEADSLLWLLHCNVYPECPWPLQFHLLTSKAEIVLLCLLHTSLGDLCKENISQRMNPECKMCWFLYAVCASV